MPRPPTTSPTGAGCSPRWPPRGLGCWPRRSPPHGPGSSTPPRAYVRFALDHPGHYAVMFDKSLYDDTDPELIAAAVAAGAELNQGVGTLGDPHAKTDPESAALAAWSLVHGFSLLWLNDAVDTVGRSDRHHRAPGADPVRWLGSVALMTQLTDIALDHALRRADHAGRICRRRSTGGQRRLQVRSDAAVHRPGEAGARTTATAG